MTIPPGGNNGITKPPSPMAVQASSLSGQPQSSGSVYSAPSPSSQMSGVTRTVSQGVFRPTWDTDTFTRIYERSSTLQSLPMNSLRSPKVLIEELVGRRDAISTELGGSGRQDGGYAFSTLVEALVAVGVVRGNIQSYIRFASARDLYERSSILQDFDPDSFSSSELLMQGVVSIRPSIVEEQRDVRGVQADMLEGYSLGALVQALVAGGKLGSRYIWMASARDLYDRSPLLRGIDDDALGSPEDLMEALVSLRPDIVAEQREIRGVSADELQDYALGTLVNALIAGGRIDDKKHSYWGMAVSRDFYERSELLRGIDADILESPERTIEELVALRPAIVAEQQAMRGSSGNKIQDYALSTLVGALIVGGWRHGG